MANPWDRPELPNRGDDTPVRTYEGVGRVVDAWEALEFSLSRLYSKLGGHPDDTRLLQRYGAGRIFRDRLALLRKMAARFFTFKPDQNLEGTFDLIADHAKGFADRRNDVAHGIVFDVRRLDFFTERFAPKYQRRSQWLLIPPLHTIRHHETSGFPSYGYGYPLLRALERALHELQFMTSDLKNVLPALEARSAIQFGHSDEP